MFFNAATTPDFILCSKQALRLTDWDTDCFLDLSLPEYVSTTLFIRAIKGGLMLSGTLAVLIC